MFTLDALHVPGEEPAKFMDGVRGGGVVLAVRGESVGCGGDFEAAWGFAG